MPRPIFEQRFGVEALYQDAVDILLPEAYGEAIDETGINPVAQPEVNVTQIEKGKDFIFEATVTVEPEVKLGDYKGLEIEKQDSELTDEELEESINHSLGHMAEMVVKKKTALLKMATQLILISVVQLMVKNSKVDKLKVTT